MKLFLAIPSASALVNGNTMASAMRAQSALMRQGVAMAFDMYSFAEVSVARNVLVARFLASDATHLLFCDDDISFEPQVIGDLISARTPVVVAGAVKRGLDLDRYAAERRQGAPGPEDDENRRRALAAATELNYTPVRPENRQGSLIEALHAGFGLALVAREAFEAIRASDSVREQAYGRQLGEQVVHGFFDRIHAADLGSTLPEDFSFCQRWRATGGRVWVIEGARTRHHGAFAYQNW